MKIQVKANNIKTGVYRLSLNKSTNTGLQGYQDSNLELTESESVALPFGDIPSARDIIDAVRQKVNN